jgi:hypothetical protein
MRGLTIGLAVGAALLAGCSKPADTGNAAAGAAVANSAAASASAAASTATAAANVAATAAGPAGPITLAQLPAPTAGQWSRTSSQDGGATTTGTKCMDGKPIDPTDGMMKCAKLDAVRTASGGFAVTGDCPNNGIDAKLTLSGEGDFSKQFTTDSTMTMTGGPGGDMTTKNHSVYSYVGPTCTK